MLLKDVRIEYQGYQYYAEVNINSQWILINPNDAHIMPSAFKQRNIDGFSEEGAKGICLKLIDNLPPLKMYFRTASQALRVLKRLQIFACFYRDSSTSDDSD